MKKYKKYIKDAIVWNGHLKIWQRGRDFTYYGNTFINEKEVPCYSTPYALNTIFHDVYQYKHWMKKYIGTNKDVKSLILNK